ncbi:MAG TPA: BlaI/MecI/CopY family transcriptional regulator [Candidatus Limnocylindrales bacterium]|nr:BlaI/MecI/CopY family transcriptional regulator [Candidatus Limnocylindrales bacterium]
MEANVLGPLERRVMTHLWRSGPSTVAETRDALNAGSDPSLAYTTVMTILVRLHEKGYVNRTPEGRHYRYSATFDETSLPAAAGRRELRRLIERHGAATVAGFAADLTGVDSELASHLRELAGRDEETK